MGRGIKVDPLPDIGSPQQMARDAICGTVRERLWCNIGTCYLHLDRLKEAYSAFNEASKAAEEINDIKVMGKIAFQYAMLDEKENKKEDIVLARFKTAETYAKQCGNVDGQIESLYEQAAIYIKLSEYDSALRKLKEAQRLLEISPALRHCININYLIFEIKVRRGKAQEAFKEIDLFIIELENSGNILHAFKLRWMVLIMLIHLPVLSPSTIAYVDKLINTRASLASISRIDGLNWLPSEFDLKKIRDVILNEKEIQVPIFISTLATKTEEMDKVKYYVAIAEYEANISILPELWSSIYQSEPNPYRKRDYALALIDASIRAGDDEQRLNGLNYLGIAEDLLGNSYKAIECYEEALKTNPPHESESWAILESNLSYAKSHLVNPAKGIEILLGNLKELIKFGHIRQANHARVHLSRCYADSGDYSKAIECAEEALNELKGDDVNKSLILVLNSLNESWHRLRSSSPNIHDIIDFSSTSDFINSKLSRDKFDLNRVDYSETSAPDLAEMGILATEQGLLNEAEDYIQRALKLYEDDNYQLGIAKCYNNLAVIAENRRQWEKAIELSKHSLNIRELIYDTVGIVRTLGYLAKFSFMSGDYQKSISFAEQCNKYQDTMHHPSDLLAVKFYRALSFCLLKDWGGIEDSISILEKITANQEVALPDGFIESLRRLANRLKNESTQFEKNDIALKEVERLTRIHQYDEAMVLIEDLIKNNATASCESRGKILGTKANILRNKGLYEEALAAYRAAADLFKEAEKDGNEVQAIIYSALCLEYLGKTEEAIKTLRAVIKRCPSCSQRSVAFMTLATTLWRPGYKKERKLPPDDVLEEARQLYQYALQENGVDDISAGTILRAGAQLEVLDGKVDRALEMLAKAKIHFTSANSYELDQVNEQIETILNNLEYEEE